jgi:TniQ
MNGPRWPALPRPLPRTVAPLQHETHTSYLGRLAAANRSSVDDLDELAGLDDDDPDCLDRLAALSRQPAFTLLCALPELRHHPDIDTSALRAAPCPTPQTFINDIRPACRRCAAAAGISPGAVQVWASHDTNVCLRHRIWIGEGNDHPRQQVDLRPHPDIVRAQIRHRRLIRRCGRAGIHAAYTAACSTWFDLTQTGGYTRQRDRRINNHLSTQDNSTIDAPQAINHAATYPEAIALTAILASPYWRSALTSRRPAGNNRFHDELRRRVTPDHHGNGPPRFLFWLRRSLDRADLQDDCQPPPWMAR